MKLPQISKPIICGPVRPELNLEVYIYPMPTEAYQMAEGAETHL